VHVKTLKKWVDSGKIEAIKTAAGQRKYKLDPYLQNNRQRITVCYCQVSSAKQRDDFFKRKGLKAL
jgi:predicted site-specific integrase-resolvase